MSEIKALDKLRMYAHNFADEILDEYAVKAIADEIEREIQERYMLLPVDADGVPIHVGDELDWCGYGIKVCGVCHDALWYDHDGELGWESTWSNECTHVKPRTLEDVLCDLASETSCMGDGIVRHFTHEDVAAYAAEIRELLGGDAE